MKKQEVGKTQIIEAVSMISKRRRNLRLFEEECELHSWSSSDATELLTGVHSDYQDRYDAIIENTKVELEKLSNDMLEGCFAEEYKEHQTLKEEWQETEDEKRRKREALVLFGEVCFILVVLFGVIYKIDYLIGGGLSLLCLSFLLLIIIAFLNDSI
ncbi:TPA: hypothetical protein U1C30_002149 [Streptococcus suis]|nr:hypothetical protein [Streptococcus suis]